MRSKAKRWLAPPVFDTEEKNRVSRILYVILSTFMVAAVVVIIVNLAFGNMPTVYSVTGGLIVIIGSIWLARRGYLSLAGFLVLLALLASINFLLFVGNGIHDVAVMVFPIAIVGAGLILEPKPFMAIVSLTMISLGAISVSEMNGIIDSPMTAFTEFDDIIVTQTILLITAIASRLTADEVVKSLALAQKSGRALQVKNKELQREIAERKETEKALLDSEVRYRSLFEDSPISLWEQDFSDVKLYLDELILENGPDIDLESYLRANPHVLHKCARLVKIVDFNQATLSQFGANSKNKLMTNLFSIFPPPVADVFREELVQLAGGATEFESEVALQTLDGRPIFVLHRLVVAPGYEESWSKVFISILDISLRKKMEAELEEYRDHLEKLVNRRTEELVAAKDAAEAANRAKSAFLANMSHELRTPLNAIMGFTQLMQRDVEIPPHLQENLRIVNGSGEHLLNLINDVLEISKIEAGQAGFSRTSFDLPAMLTHLDETFRIQAEAKGLRLILELPKNLPRFVTGDERKLQQVLTNLLSNAVKFTPKGRVALRVAMDKVERATAVLQFIIEDTGPGISDEHLKDIFEPFAQKGKGQASQQGTGLGLPISRQFIRLMGGELEVSSRIDQGSIFRFTLQVSLAAQNAQPATMGAGRVIGLSPNQPEYRILVVEDRYENRILLRRLLEWVGFAVREATNGAEAVEVHRLWQPHLIWMDMRMPVMNGYEAVSQIRSTTQGQATTIIALTASAFEEDRAVVLSAGCDDFIRKPFLEADIFAKMGKHLGVQYLYAESPQAEPKMREFSGGLTPAALMSLPDHWLERLHQAARGARSGKILALLQEIEPDHTVLANQLVQMVENFQFDEIMKLTENNDINYEHNGQWIN